MLLYINGMPSFECSTDSRHLHALRGKSANYSSGWEGIAKYAMLKTHQIASGPRSWRNDAQGAVHQANAPHSFEWGTVGSISRSGPEAYYRRLG